MIWQSPGLPGWQKVNFINVTRRPHHPNIAVSLYCLATSPGFLPTLCEKWSGFFYVHRVFLSYTRDRPLYKVSSERLGNEDKSALPKGATAGPGLEPGTSGMEFRGSNRSATTAPQKNAVNTVNRCNTHTHTQTNKPNQTADLSISLVWHVAYQLGTVQVCIKAVVKRLPEPKPTV